MMTNKILVVVCLLLGGLPVLTGQNIAPVIEWQKCFGSSGEEDMSSIVPTSDGGYIFLAEGGSLYMDGDLTGIPGHGDTKDFWVVKLSPYYTIEWQRLLGGIGGEDASSIVQTTDGGYIVFGQASFTNGDVTCADGRSSDAWLVKLTPNGLTQWEKCLGGSGDEFTSKIMNTADGGFILVGYTNSNDRDISGNHGSYDALVVKLSSVGTIQWQKCFGGTNIELIYSINATDDGGYILSGATASTDGDVIGLHGNSTDAWVIKLSALGVLQWQKCLGGSAAEGISCIIQTSDGGYIGVGGTSSTDGDVMGHYSGVNSDVWVVKLSALGVLQWQKCLGGTSTDNSNAVIQTSDGDYIIAATSVSTDGDITNPINAADGWIVKVSAQGVLKWQKTIGGRSPDRLYSIMPTFDGGYLVAGDTRSTELNGHHGDYDIWLVKLSNDVKAIGGQVQQSATFCQPLTSPQFSVNAQVKIEKDKTIYYMSADSFGRFGIFVDTGRFTVSAIPPNNLWAACPPKIVTMSNASVRDTTLVNPLVYPYIICPLMEVQLTTPLLRRCFESQYTINYANIGTGIQNDATAELTLDSMLTYISATRPVRSRVGNKITFALGDVGMNQAGQFTVNVTISCDSRLGQTHCSSVLIPKTMTCDTVQDSIPTIITQCIAGCDSIAFLINRPNSTLNKTFKYQLIADASLIDTGRFVLVTNSSIKHKKDGRTYRLELRHPMTNQLLVARAVESSPTPSTPSVSTGFVNQFSKGVKVANIAENCTTNIGSFDPNDKSAVPIGIGTRHFIEQGKTIDYLVQFQNTGTDTAFKVVVKDTLAAHFNLATFKFNATSHVATWQLNPKGVLIVTFNNINLVDSFTNEKGSHGFFKYSIKLNDSIITNTIINNKAGIYFDFNAPIITNIATHTIGKEGIKNCLIKPAITINYSGCPSKNIAFNATATNAGLNPTYTWFRNNESTPLSINAVFTLTNATKGTKIYCKTTVSSDICTETPTIVSDTIVLNCIGTPTNDIANTVQSFDVYPNPNKGVFTVKLMTIKSEQMQLNILNYLGQTIKTELINTDNYLEQLNLSHLPNGIYVIKLTINGQSIIKKMSVQ